MRLLFRLSLVLFFSFVGFASADITIVKNLTDDQLLEKVQKQTFGYFWDFAHPVSGMARERGKTGGVDLEMTAIESKWLIPAGGKKGQTGLFAEYFNNKRCEEPAAGTEIDPNVDKDWGDGAPGVFSLPADNFSIRWTGQIIAPETGEYDLGVGSDDGSRLYLDDKLFINNWGDHGYQEMSKSIQMEKGKAYNIKIIYYEKTGGARVRLGWVKPSDKADMHEKMLEAANYIDTDGGDCCATGGTGFGVMSIIVAADRKWITREQASERLLKLVRFLSTADRFHGVFPHWIDGKTGRVLPFSPKDDGGDLVETSFLFEGLLCVRQYFNADNPVEKELRDTITKLWNEVEWTWYTKNGEKVLYWHWSPDHGWEINFAVRGWMEPLIMYVLAASSPTYSIDPDVYNQGWAGNGRMKNGRQFYGITLPLGGDFGGPLFFAHYSFCGLDPRGLKDQYADYWEQNVNHTLINRAYCIENPKKFAGYGPDCWGLTASDIFSGYGAQSPTSDVGVITPTAALSSFPYTPEYSMQALKYFYYQLGEKIWRPYGFVDAFSETHNWYAKSQLAIDQGPIIDMIENYRTGLLWNLFMSVPEVKKGLKKLGFTSEKHNLDN